MKDRTIDNLVTIYCCVHTKNGDVDEDKIQSTSMKEIVQFINKQIREKTVKYYFFKENEIRFKINDADWFTMNDLIANGVFVVSK